MALYVWSVTANIFIAICNLKIFVSVATCRKTAHAGLY